MSTQAAPSALYTGAMVKRTRAVLIGLLISVIALLVVHSLLYTAERRSAEGRVYWWITLIGFGRREDRLIYVEQHDADAPGCWLEVYRSVRRASCIGRSYTRPRWTYMVVASLMAAGVAVALITAVRDRARNIPARGALRAPCSRVSQSPHGASTQPAEVTAALGGSASWLHARCGWR